MKLYTEEQVINIFEKYGNMSGIIARNIIDLSEYIELPSDEEVENWAHNKYHEVEDSRWFEPLQVGARWMRDKLTNTETE